MKNNKLFIVLCTSCIVTLSLLSGGCKPKSYMGDLPEWIPNTDSSVVLNMHPRAEADAVDPNMVHLVMDDVDGWVGLWTIGNKRYAQNRVDRRFEFAGDYHIKASAYNKYGVAPAVDVSFSIETTDETVCLNEDYRHLTGGCDEPDGKTWVLSQEKGYYGLIDINTWILEYLTDYWWAADPGSHPEVFDDEITFVLNADKTYSHVTHGKSAFDSEPAEVADYEASWEITPAKESADGRMHLTLSGDGFLPPFPSECQGQHDYIVLVLNDSVMLTKIYKSGSNQAWVNKFVPKKSE